jgi:hypothetical protein
MGVLGVCLVATASVGEVVTGTTRVGDGRNPMGVGVPVGSNASGVEVGRGVEVGFRVGVPAGGGVGVIVASIAAGVFVLGRGRLE